MTHVTVAELVLKSEIFHDTVKLKCVRKTISKGKKNNISKVSGKGVEVNKKIDLLRTFKNFHRMNRPQQMSFFY